jgi:hypothetical protein
LQGSIISVLTSAYKKTRTTTTIGTAMAAVLYSCQQSNVTFTAHKTMLQENAAHFEGEEMDDAFE